jgi:hypothetical protein
MGKEKREDWDLRQCPPEEVRELISQPLARAASRQRQRAAIRVTARLGLTPEEALSEGYLTLDDFI